MVRLEKMWLEQVESSRYILEGEQNDLQFGKDQKGKRLKGK